MRIGYGYDIHKLKKGRKLYLGGIVIPNEVGLVGHSDADVLLHAVCDALLGAAGLGDIGEHFPDTDIQFKDISSVKLLERTYELVRQKGFGIENIDCIIFAQTFRITPFKERIRKNIARVLSIGPESVNIKAKTMEGFDAVGGKKAIAASCIVLLKQD
ncbi:MAG: 2-C-methyl-D-erythritol 2,4-cyclodiphosphate synthase [Candidatus Omnitrophica bacterium]|nr:2-C-methyl-D-erythritol 2,4-cyclodiphosphate synthase [Candidatus Omnitrophota bacterium]MBU1924625.1 2-C-methyl-D-erythritol 2,4-cyclodiphosphate synthase [Candidatus Omnitrophota bacterium]MBU2063901.1 2-C-methyl-D-erythritol 2,4-cyclodiphosphate synthase [Candidatus Omnitrophota bacterium]